MKKLTIFGVIVALLFASTSQATYYNPLVAHSFFGAVDQTALSEGDIIAYDPRLTNPSSFLNYVELGKAVSGDGTNDPYFELHSTYLTIDGTPFNTILATKADTTTVTSLASSVSAIPAQQASDWTASSGVTRILNKPTLFSGNYSDLAGKPTLFDGTYSSLTGKPTIPTLPTSYENTTGHNIYYIYKTATVASGVAVYQLTADNTSTGTALCSTPIAASVQPIVNDATSSYQMGWAFSNSNKTLTVTTNNFTTANILSGILGQSPANGKVVNLSVACY